MKRSSEKWLEATLVSRVKAKGGMCLKFVSPGNNGVPDRIVLMPGGRLWFVELKSEGQVLRPLQEYWRRKLEEFNHVVIDSENTLNEYIQTL